jgi:hypothetical protein
MFSAPASVPFPGRMAWSVDERPPLARSLWRLAPLPGRKGQFGLVAGGLALGHRDSLASGPSQRIQRREPNRPPWLGVVTLPQPLREGTDLRTAKFRPPAEG